MTLENGAENNVGACKMPRARWDIGIGYEERDVFEAYLKLPVPQRRTIREIILTFSKVHSE